MKPTRLMGHGCTFVALSLAGVFTCTWAQEPTRSQSLDWLNRRIPRPSAMLGIDHIAGNSSLTISEDSVYMKFGSEPRVMEVDPEGPSAGILRRGDVIVAVDNLLITTAQAGFRYANLVAGEPVELTIRRSGRVSTVTVVPAAPSEEDYHDVGMTIQEVRRLRHLVDSFLGSGGFNSTAFLQEVVAPEIRALLGMSLIFPGQAVRREDHGTLWRFDQPPRITFIEPGGPADLGGLEVGDVLTHIDGTPLDRARGGRLFSSITPGQRVVWTVNRDGRVLEIETVAVGPPRAEPHTGR